MNWLNGRCFEALGDTDNALRAYTVVYINFASSIRYSADAWVRAAQLTHTRGDAAGAYTMVKDVAQRMADLEGNAEDVTSSITRAKTLRAEWATVLGRDIEKEDALLRKKKP
jgi:hypothetical protein